MKASLKRIFDTGWTNFKRNSYLSLGTTGVMVLVLSMFSGLLAVNYISSRIVSTLQDKVDVSVYFKNEAKEEEILQVKNDLESLSQVKVVTYISKDQAFEDFKQKHAGDALIQESLAELESNPLQASLNVKANESSQYASIAGFLEENKLRSVVDKINFYENEQVIKRVEGIYRGIQNWGFIATMALALVAVLVTFNTIRLTIYNQKQEIEIMRLVGGSSWHIKAPYLVEGGLYGAFAGLITIAMFYPAVIFASPKVEALMPEVGLLGYFLTNILQFAGLVLLVGILLGAVSSFVAIRRFLKV